MSDLKLKQKAWIDTNPLRVFRKANGLSMTDVAARLGVSVTTVQKWEFGGGVPHDQENMPRIGNLLGIDNPIDVWGEWISQRPKESKYPPDLGPADPSVTHGAELGKLAKNDAMMNTKAGQDLDNQARQAVSECQGEYKIQGNQLKVERNG